MSVHQKVEQSFVCLLPRVQQPCLSLWQIRHSLFCSGLLCRSRKTDRPIRRKTLFLSDTESAVNIQYMFAFIFYEIVKEFRMERRRFLKRTVSHCDTF